MMKMNDVRITILDGSPDHPAEGINHVEHVDGSSVIDVVKSEDPLSEESAKQLNRESRSRKSK